MGDDILKRIEDRLCRIEAMLESQRQEKPAKAVMSAEEVAKYTGYAKKYLYKLTGEKQIPHYKRGGKVLFIKEEIDQWLQEHKVSSENEIQRAAQEYCSARRNTN